MSIYSTGSFLYFIFPGAYVNMDDHLLKLLKPFQQLRIFCAGVWHNFWLCIICYICLITMPYWLCFGYNQSDNELYVLDVNKVYIYKLLLLIYFNSSNNNNNNTIYFFFL